MAIPFEINRSKIVGNIATLLSGSIVAQGMTAFALLITARQLKVDGYGQYTACITLTSMLSIIFSLGLDVWLLREGGRAPSRIAEIAGSVLSIKALIGLIWILGLWFIVPFFNQQSFPTTLLHWSVILLWSDTLLATCLTTFKSVLQTKTPAILEASADAIWFGLTLLLISLRMQQAEVYLRIRVLVSILALGITFIFLFRRFGLRFNLSIIRQAITEAFPFATSDFLSMINMRGDVVIVSLILGKTATGIYSPAVGLVNMAFLVPLAVYLVMVPVLSNLYNHHSQQAAKTAIRTIALSLMLGVGLTIVFILGSPLVVLVLGQSYTGSIQILKILSWVLLFKCGSYAMAAILVATDQQINRTNIQIIAALSNIVLNLIAVTWLGIQGVAYIYVLTEMILFGGYTLFVVRKIRSLAN
jgi:O-antigen/teichoic acid export membrane protein